MSYFYKNFNTIRNSLVLFSWVPVVMTFGNHVYQPCLIKGRSMTPTLNPGIHNKSSDIVVVQKYNLKKPDSFSRGDIVMFRSPQDPGKLLTKRVVGKQGDVVAPKSPPYPRLEAIVPRNHFWVEGDNTFHSIDSNNFGPISQALVVGKVVMVVWPLSRFGFNISRGGRDARKPSQHEESSIKS